MREASVANTRTNANVATTSTIGSLKVSLIFSGKSRPIARPNSTYNIGRVTAVLRMRFDTPATSTSPINNAQIAIKSMVYSGGLLDNKISLTRRSP